MPPDLREPCGLLFAARKDCPLVEQTAVRICPSEAAGRRVEPQPQGTREKLAASLHVRGSKPQLSAALVGQGRAKHDMNGLKIKVLSVLFPGISSCFSWCIILMQ